MKLPRTLTAIALAATLCVAGCSADSEADPPATESVPTSPESETTPSEAIADEPVDLAAFLTDCMRDQGISDFPEAEVLPDGSLDLDMDALDAAGIGPGSPDFNTAFAACETEAGQTIELGDHTDQ